MKILYGIQGTGNGHITRARALNQHFQQFGLAVDFVFSGRDREDYFDMNEFGENWRSFRGLTFLHNAGRIDSIETVRKTNIRQIIKDVNNLKLDHYDLVVTDFEPITAHAALRQGVPSIGIGHQYAFSHNIPLAEETLLGKQLLRCLAPAERSLGLHWHHYNSPILPPIAKIPKSDFPMESNKILVYLGFEDPEDVIQMLEPFKNFVFVVYGPFDQYQRLDHIQLKPLSRQGFCRDLHTCSGVITNAGFELASEAIQLGRKLLVKPLHGQMEQRSNAKALVELGFGMSMLALDSKTLQFWLTSFESKQMIYPDVAFAIVEWISRGRWDNVKELSQDLWQKTQRLNETIALTPNWIQSPPTRAKESTHRAIKQTEEVVAGMHG